MTPCYGRLFVFIRLRRGSIRGQGGRTGAGRRMNAISRDSVRAVAQSVGETISDSAALALAQDVEMRIRMVAEVRTEPARLPGRAALWPRLPRRIRLAARRKMTRPAAHRTP
jgi:hypothetical protein